MLNWSNLLTDQIIKEDLLCNLHLCSICFSTLKRETEPKSCIVHFIMPFITVVNRFYILYTIHVHLFLYKVVDMVVLCICELNYYFWVYKYLYDICLHVYILLLNQIMLS